MNRQPDLIAPVLVIALALIVVGGLATGRAPSGASAGATVPLPLDDTGPPASAGTPTAATTIAPNATGTAPVNETAMRAANAATE